MAPGRRPYLTCANCGARASEAEAEDSGWRYWSDGVGGLHAFCPTSAEREFSPNAPVSNKAGEQPLMRFIDADFYGPPRAAWRLLKRLRHRSGQRRPGA